MSYTGADIEVLEGLEPVRKRPGMFIAGTDTPAGLHQLVYEILDNSVDEAMNGHASEISLTLHTDGESVTISDNGRGIPVDKHPKFGKPTLELILTTLHAGGKFSDKNYQTAGGLHGVGSSVVNALSEELRATIRRDGKEYVQTFSRGRTQTALKSSKSSIPGTGTSIFFRPDPEIFPSIKFSTVLLEETLRIKAYLHPGVRFHYFDEKTNKRVEFKYTDGIQAYLKSLLEEKKVKPIGDEIFTLSRKDDVQIDVSLCWTEQPSESFITFANGISTPDGGSHEIGAKAGILRAVRNYFSVHDVQTKGLKIAAEDIREGLLCVVSVKLPGGKYQAQFQGQTKSKLNNPEVSPLVETVVKNLEQILNEKPTAAHAITQRVILAAKARQASREAVDQVRRKTPVSHRLNLPGKLADCSSSKLEETELFLVEGDSAAGTAKQGRDRNTQAILPLRGKVLNSMTATGKKLRDNGELSNIISALGCGAANEIKLEKLRYGKVIILTDADADGMLIATLLLAFFFQQMRPLIDEGRIYLGNPPLYGVYPQKKKTVSWAYSDQELQKLMKQTQNTAARVVRYKGLGEMNASTLWETTLDPKTRVLSRVKADDAIRAEKSLEALMGSDPSYRYQLITENGSSIDADI